MKLSLDDRILSPVELICRVDGLPMPVAEYRFHPERKWAFDWAWHYYRLEQMPLMVALEIEGGIWLKGQRQGRHTRGKGYLEDISKYNAAVALGWKVYRCTPQTIHLVMPLVAKALQG